MLYHVNTSGPSIEGFQKAFAKAIATSIENDTNEFVVFVHTKGNLNGIISDAIGGIANKLQKNGSTTFSGVSVFLETDKIKSSFHSGVIIAAHLSPKSLTKALSDPRATDVVYVPWASEELDEYLKSHQSTEI